MKIFFYDTKEHEEEYYNTHVLEKIEKFYFKTSINKCNLPSETFQDVDYLSVFVTSQLDFSTLQMFPNLKCIFTRSAGFDHIDLKYCKNNGIKVFNTPHYGDRTIAEFTFALLLSLVKRINEGVSVIKSSNFNRDIVGLELHNKTMGIIGMGSIGEKVAKIAQGFGMKVFGYDKNQKEGFNYLDLDKLLSISDIISLHCPLTSQTFHLLNKERISKMKHGVIILNTSRGEVIHTEALLEQIENGYIKYAGLDVVECENISSNLNKNDFSIECTKPECFEKYAIIRRLLSHKNVIITPHIAYSTQEALFRISEITASNINCYVKNQYNLCLNNQVLL